MSLLLMLTEPSFLTWVFCDLNAEMQGAGGELQRKGNSNTNPPLSAATITLLGDREAHEGTRAKAWRISIGLLELGQCPILERPATQRHTQHKPIIEDSGSEPLHDTTTSRSGDVKKVMDEIKRKLVTWG